MKNLTAVYTRDETDAWIVELQEEQRCHAFGRTFAQARKRIIDAAELWSEEAVEIHDLVRLSPDVDPVVAEALQLRRQEAELAEQASQATRRAVELLTIKAGLSMRDAGAVLGLSHQRVHQLTAG